MGSGHARESGSGAGAERGIQISSSPRPAMPQTRRPGVECVGPLKVGDTVATARLDISKGSLPLPTGAGVGISPDEGKFERYCPH